MVGGSALGEEDDVAGPHAPTLATWGSCASASRAFWHATSVKPVALNCTGNDSSSASVPPYEVAMPCARS